MFKKSLWILWIHILFVSCWAMLGTVLGACRPLPPESENPLWVMGGNNTDMPALTLPFPSGEYWQITHGYNLVGDPNDSHQDYSWDFGDDHLALDFSQVGCKPYNKEVTPLADGTVLDLDVDNGCTNCYGNSLLVEHANGYVSRYAHLSQIFVSVGDYVDVNDYIGLVGNTGYVLSNGACAEHPGTHLHIAVYKEGDGVKPEPLSGQTDLSVGCWYNREGMESCNGDPGDYGNYDDEGTGIDNSGNLDISFLEIDPEEGTAGETQYIWTAIVVSPNEEPAATLLVSNPIDLVTYEFPMETVSEESPWIFTYRKTLQSAVTYSYWVEAETPDYDDTSGVQQVAVNPSVSPYLEVDDLQVSPSSGTANETLFTWTVNVESGPAPDLSLQIVNPNDATIYVFNMDVVNVGGTSWTASYFKTLSTETVYAYWVVADNGSSTQTTEVMSIEVEGSGTTGTDETTTEDTGAPASEDTGTEPEPPIEPNCSFTVPTDFVNIQDAIDTASDGDTICVETGSYLENLVIDSLSVTLLAVDGPEATILDGGNLASTVSILSGSEATIDGFTIRGGSDVYAGGLYIDNASPTVQHCRITENDFYGIGIWNGATPVIRNSIIVGNISRGVYVTNASEPELTNVVIADNGSSGIGVYGNSIATVMNSIVSDNAGYGVYSHSSAGDTSVLVLSFNDLFDNFSGNYGGSAIAGLGDLGADPSFIDHNEFLLNAGSVCIDSGNSAPSFNDADGSRNDMGAYGGPFGSWP